MHVEKQSLDPSQVLKSEGHSTMCCAGMPASSQPMQTSIAMTSVEHRVSCITGTQQASDVRDVQGIPVVHRVRISAGRVERKLELTRTASRGKAPCRESRRTQTFRRTDSTS